MRSSDEDYCYLTTSGRRTGRPHRIEIWFVSDGRSIYLLAGGGRSSDWIRNIATDPAVRVELGSQAWHGQARVLDGDEAGRARDLVYAKYTSRSTGDLSGWRDSALPIAIDLEEA